MLSKEISLGGRTFVLNELPRLANAEWRARLELALQPLLDLMGNIQQIEINTPADIGNLVNALRGVLLRAPDVLTELIISYSPELQAEEDWINKNVYESELLGAIQEVIVLAYPLGKAVELGRQLNGLAQLPSKQMSKNSSSRSTRRKRGGTKLRSTS